LRALFFALSGVASRFHYLKQALSIILLFVGLKMIVSGFVKVPISLSLSVIFGVLVLAIILSAIKERRDSHAKPEK